MYRLDTSGSGQRDQIKTELTLKDIRNNENLYHFKFKFELQGQDVEVRNENEGCQH